MESNLSLQNASFSYGEKQILHDLDLEVSRGQICCILGANGCGKTTLLRCLAGTLGLRGGKVCIDGYDISTLKAHQRARRVGIVFQEHHIPFPYKVLDVVRMGRTAHVGLFDTPSRDDTRIAEEKLEMLGISYLKNEPYNHISGGERQLVLIARTMAQEPGIILLDEPTSHLDLRNQVKILNIINQLASNGLTVIMSTHFPNHAFLLEGKAVIMHEGSFLAIGKPSQVVTEANMRVAYGVEVTIAGVPLAGTEETVKVCVPVVPKPNDTVFHPYEGIAE